MTFSLTILQVVLTHTHTPVIQVLLLLVATSGSVVVAGWRTRTASVRKLIIQTPESKEERRKERKKKTYVRLVVRHYCRRLIWLGQ